MEQVEVNERTVGEVNINSFYHFTRIVIFTCFILALFPIYHLIKHVFMESKCCHKTSGIIDDDNKVNTEKPLFIQSKIILSISVLFYISYISLCAMDAFAKYFYVGMDTIFCKVMYVMSVCLFVIAKAFLYNYFILRANDTFYNTAYEYNQWYIQLVLPIELIIITGIMFPVTYIFFYDVEYDVVTTNINEGQICILTFPLHTYEYQTIAFGIGGFIDIVFSLVAVGFLLVKLLMIIQETSKDTNYEWKKSSNITNNTEEIYDLLTNETNILINEHVSYQSNTNNITMCRNNDDSDNDNDSSLLPIQITSVDYGGKKKTRNNDIESETISPSEIYGFHSNTNINNRLLLLITKLLILLFVEIIAMILAGFIYYFSNLIFWGYVIDSCVDIYCLFLSFRFSEKYYYETFGGHKCSKFFFPFVKTIGLGYRCRCCLCYELMDNYSSKPNEQSGISNIFSNTNSTAMDVDFTIFEQCCTCCYYCCCCRGIRRQCCIKCYRMRCKKQKQIYKLANKEIDLLLATALSYKPRNDMDVWNPPVI